MNERIEFVTPIVISDGAGGTKRTGWQTQHTCWADVKALSGSRALEFEKIVGKRGFDVTMRFQGDFTPTDKMTIKWRDIMLTIHGLLDVRFTNRMINFVAYG